MTTLFIDALALWAPTLPGWDLARAAFRGEGAPIDSMRQAPRSRPSLELLAPAERRRAPDTVALALEVAAVAVASSGHAASELSSV